MKRGYTLIESLIALSILGVLILSIILFLTSGIKDYIITENRSIIKAQEIAREILNGKPGDNRYGFLGEIRSLISLSKAEQGTLTLIKSIGERYVDNDLDGFFDNSETIILDGDRNFSYEQGTDTLILGVTPEQGTPLFNFNPDEKHTDNGLTMYQFDNNEAIIRDANHNNQYDAGEIVLVGNPSIGAMVVPFGKTITYYLDMVNRQVKRVENNTLTETVGKSIMVDDATNSFGLSFKYFNSSGGELIPLPLTTEQIDKVSWIEICLGIDIDGDKKSDFSLKTRAASMLP